MNFSCLIYYIFIYYILYINSETHFSKSEMNFPRSEIDFSSWEIDFSKSEINFLGNTFLEK